MNIYTRTRQLAVLKGHEDAVLFPCGFSANVAVAAVLAAENDVHFFFFFCVLFFSANVAVTAMLAAENYVRFFLVFYVLFFLANVAVAAVLAAENDVLV